MTTIVRLIALLTLLGAFLAADNLYGASHRTWQSVITSWRGAIERPAEASPATEDWPICTAMGQIGSEADWQEGTRCRGLERGRHRLQARGIARPA